MNLFTNKKENNITQIQGLTYIPNFITTEKERFLISQVDKQNWSNEFKRRVQHYGYKYDYKSRKITADLKIGEIPHWLKINPQFNHFDQVIVNEYQCGQGISAHIDCIPCFKDRIYILSLLSNCEMIFEKDNIKIPIILEVKSLVIFEKDARYKWTHCIPARKSNVKNRRVSITYRKVIL